jgi:hypothetical protein
MRASARILLGLGLVVLALAAVVRFVVPDLAVKYPADLDQTAKATGTFTLYLNPVTKAPLAQPVQGRLDIDRRLRVVESTGSRAVVQETDDQVITLPILREPLRQRFLQQFVLDRSTLRNLADGRSFAYGPGSPVDRAPNYSVNLPFSTGDGPYPIWKNEVGRAYDFRSEGTVRREGLTLTRLRGQLRDARVQAYYLDQLGAAGVTRTATLTELRPQLQAQGIDLVGLTRTVLPRMSPADRAVLVRLAGEPVRLDYRLDVDTRLQVEPTTGAIVALDRIAQTLAVRPDPASVRPLRAVLQRYAGDPVVSSALSGLDRLESGPPTRVFAVDYGQTAASVARIADYAAGKADQIRLVRRWLPLTLLLIGGLLLAGGVVLTRRRPAQPARPAQPSQPAQLSQPAAAGPPLPRAGEATGGSAPGGGTEPVERPVG